MIRPYKFLPPSQFYHISILGTIFASFQIAEQTNAFFWFWHLYQKVSLNDACLSKKKIFYDILHIARKKIKAYTNTCTNAKGLFRTALDNTYLVYISYTYIPKYSAVDGGC